MKIKNNEMRLNMKGKYMECLKKEIAYAKMILPRLERVNKSFLIHSRERAKGNINLLFGKLKDDFSKMSITDIYGSWKNLERYIEQAESVLYRSIEKK